MAQQKRWSYDESTPAKIAIVSSNVARSQIQTQTQKSSVTRAKYLGPSKLSHEELERQRPSRIDC